MIDQFRNLATLFERSYSVSGEYVIASDRLGTFTVSTGGAIFETCSFQDMPGHAFIEYAGATNNAGGGGGFGGTLPRYRFFTTLDWTYHNFDVTVSNTYVSATNDTGLIGRFVYGTVAVSFRQERIS